MKSSVLLISLGTLGIASAGVGGYFVFTQGQTVPNINNVVQQTESQVQNQISSNKKDFQNNIIQPSKSSVKKFKPSEKYINWSEKHGFLERLW